MRTTSRMRLHMPALLLALLLLPVASAEDAPIRPWESGREVRVATAPALRQMPATLADSAPMPSLAHGYASLVERHARLRFLEQAYPSGSASVVAVCQHKADLVLVMGQSRQQPRPCPGLLESVAFPGGRTMLAGRAGQPCRTISWSWEQGCWPSSKAGPTPIGLPCTIPASSGCTWPIGMPRWRRSRAASPTSQSAWKRPCGP